MKSSTLVTLLVRVTTALALAAPCVMFGFLYVLAVQPQRTAARTAQQQVQALRAELARQRGMVRSAPGVTDASARGEFRLRTPEENRADEVAEALESLANSPLVGGVRNLSIETAPGIDVPDSRIELFQEPVAHIPVTVTFDARYEQVGRFFWNLRALPSTFELRSVELTPASVAPLMQVKAGVFVFQRQTPTQPPVIPAAGPQVVDVLTAPEWGRDPFASAPPSPKVVAVAPPPPPDPVVQSILFSGPWRVALVDGRIVRAGDRLGSAVVRAVEPDAVVIVTSSGDIRRLLLDRPTIHTARK